MRKPQKGFVKTGALNNKLIDNTASVSGGVGFVKGNYVNRYWLDWANKKGNVVSGVNSTINNNWASSVIQFVCTKSTPEFLIKPTLTMIVAPESTKISVTCSYQDLFKNAAIPAKTVSPKAFVWTNDRSVIT
jgi:hypothetical protein